MKPQFRLLFVVLTIVVNSSAAFAQALAPIYFAIRSDSSQGSGTLTDPFNGKAKTLGDSLPSGWASWFDYNMHSLGPNTQVNLASGTYETQGNNDGNATHGFLLQPNITLRGAGMGVTIVKLVGINATAGGTHIAISSGDYAKAPLLASLANCDNVSVENITVDCNSINVIGQPTINSWDAVYGVFLSGSNCSIRGVEVVNSYGRQVGSGPYAEGFALEITGGTENITNAAIQNCIVRNPVGNYVIGITLAGYYNPSGNPPANTTASGIVSGNTVIGNPWVGYSGGNTVSSIFANNIAQDVRFGFRQDTGQLNRVTFNNNSFVGSESAFNLTLQNAGFLNSKIIVSNNTFSGEVAGQFDGDGRGVINLNAVGGAQVSDITFQNNSISSSNANYPAIYQYPGSQYSKITYSNTTTTLSTTFQPGTTIDYGNSVGGSPSYNILNANEVRVAADSWPSYRLIGSNANVNERWWDIFYDVFNRQLTGRLLSDDGQATVDWLRVRRNQLTATQIDFIASNSINIYGVLRPQTGLTVTGSTTLSSLTATGIATVAALNVGAGSTVTKTTSSSQSLNIGNVPANGEATFAFTFSGAALSGGTPDVSVTWASPLPTNLVMKSASVTSDGVVSIAFRNLSSATINPGSRLCRITITNF
ncbi:MAG: hypothetical protein PHC88_04880 [Terrimicrobiaceae bacterium]|nr:hypothetical protein [Terrimicrobiaceae bacterium]